MPHPEPAPKLSQVGILRLSHLELRVGDLELAAAFYTEVLGLVETGHDADHVYLKCWDDPDHHSLALLQHPGAGLEHVSFRVEHDDDLDEAERAAAGAGAPTRRLVAGEEVGQGGALRIQAPSGHEVELVRELTRTGSLLPAVNPPPEPRGLTGIHPPRLDHVHVTAEDVRAAAAFFTGVLGFRSTERLMSAEGALLGVWLERSGTPCDVAVTRGPDGGLRHAGFWVDDWDGLRRAADILAADGIPIEAGPARRGITRSLVLDFFDPSGIRNELLTGGYRPDPDAQPTTWTEDEIGRAFAWYRGRLDPHTLTVAGP